MLRRSLCLMAFAALESPVWAADPASNSAVLRPMPAPTTDAFLARAAAASVFEIESSRLALGKSRSSAVRAFADRVIADHALADDTFDKVVTEAELAAPAKQMDRQQRLFVQDLKMKDATAFDEQYVQAQYTVQVEAVEMFRAYAASGDNARLQKFARDQLPTLEAHLTQVKKLRK
jgi:putative membrane protein